MKVIFKRLVLDYKVSSNTSSEKRLKEETESFFLQIILIKDF